MLIKEKKHIVKYVASELFKLSLHFVDNCVFKEVFFNSKVILTDYEE